MSESLQSEIMTRRKSEENRRVVIIKSFLSDEMAMGCECCVVSLLLVHILPY